MLEGNNTGRKERDVEKGADYAMFGYVFDYVSVIE